MRIFPANRPGRWLLLLALAALLPAAGCGKGTGTVTGKVTINDTPLKGGLVVFTPADGVGPPGNSPIAEDGTYTIEKCPKGHMKVSVQTAFLKTQAPSRGGARAYERPKDAPADDGGRGYKPPDPSENAKKYVAIPPKYEDPDTSDLTFDVTGGNQTYDITLK
jgi:hypothetical protein